MNYVTSDMFRSNSNISESRGHAENPRQRSLATRHSPLATGFTLIELILVMVILTTILGMAGPSLRGFFARHQIDDTAARIIALTQFAQSQAICEGRTYRLNFDESRKTYWLTVQDQGAYRDLYTEWGRVFMLAPDISMQLWDLDREGLRHYVEFNALGRTTPCTIQLIGPKGMASHSKRQIQASCLAKSKLSELVASQAWQNTARSGNFGRDWPDYEWKLESSSWRLSSVYELAVRVSWQGPASVENRSVLLSTLVYAEND